MKNGCPPHHRHEFTMHAVPRCRDGKGEELLGRQAGRGIESRVTEVTPAGYSRRVTPLAFIHRRVRPLDGWMVVANPYHLAAWPRLGLVLQAPKAVPWTMDHGPWSICTTLGGQLLGRKGG